MREGLMWFDRDPKSELTMKVERAAARYSQKYGKVPNLCFVHPSMLPVQEGQADAPLNHAGIQIRPDRFILPNNFWIGVEEAPEVESAQ